MAVAVAIKLRSSVRRISPGTISGRGRNRAGSKETDGQARWRSFVVAIATRDHHHDHPPSNGYLGVRRLLRDDWTFDADHIHEGAHCPDLVSPFNQGGRDERSGPKN